MKKDVVFGRVETRLICSDISQVLGSLKGIDLALHTVPIEQIDRESLIGLIQENKIELEQVLLKMMERLLDTGDGE